MTNVYVTGPMRGVPEFNFPLFDQVSVRLRQNGFDVFSPADSDRESGFTTDGLTGNENLAELGFDLRAALAEDMKYIAETADAVCVLPGWEQSSGARAEVALARALGLPVGEPGAFSYVLLHDDITDRTPMLLPSQMLVDDRPSSGTILPAGEVRTVSSTGGEKGVKPQRYDLIPVLPLDLVAELYANGAAKYAAHNWRRGYAWSNSYAAAMRHMTRFWEGEDIDPEMGTPHVINAVFHMFALAQFMTDFPQFDDRFVPPTTESSTP